MSQKIHYFDINAYGEAIRYMLYYSGDKFEDLRYGEEWPVKEVKDRLPFGKMPFYEEGDHSVDQSIAIARYVAHKYNLLPPRPWDQAVLDSFVLHLYEFFEKTSAWYEETDPDKKEARKRDFLDVQVDYYLSKFEKDLKKNNGHIGGKLYWADFMLLGIIEATNLALEVEIEKNYPAIQALMEKIRNLPGVKEYIAKRKPYKF